MNLVLFDVDGTLLDNRRWDDDCYVRAFRREFGVESIDTDWSRFTHCTDSFITPAILAAHFGRPAEDSEVARARQAYAAELRGALESGAAVSTPMRGVEQALASFVDDGWGCALATGGWRVCALLKLEHARLPVTALPGAFADDHFSRERIIQIARARAEAAASRAASRVAYVGDAVWDVKACAALSLPFVGIARGERADRLRAAGAEIVLDDFADVAAFRTALDRAAPPRYKGDGSPHGA